jgi:hypothetical protein
MKRTLIVLVALFAMVAFVSSVMAQAPKAEKPAAAAPEKAAAPAAEKPKVEKADKPKADKPKAPKAMKFMGMVAGYEAGKMIKVKGAKDKEMSFDIAADAKINGEVKDGAKVTVTYKKDGDKMMATAIAVAAEKKPKAEKKEMKKEEPKKEEKKG